MWENIKEACVIVKYRNEYEHENNIDLSLPESGEGKRRNDFAEWHVAWLGEWNNYAEFNVSKMTQRNKSNRKACARLLRAFFAPIWRSNLFTSPFNTAIKTRGTSAWTRPSFSSKNYRAPRGNVHYVIMSYSP